VNDGLRRRMAEKAHCTSGLTTQHPHVRVPGMGTRQSPIDGTARDLSCPPQCSWRSRCCWLDWGRVRCRLRSRLVIVIPRFVVVDPC
jgi:hypothetical protein